MSTESAILVVGAGPVGLTLANELARFGVPVRIVDKAPGRSTHSKALVVWSRTLEALQRAGLADRFTDAGRAVTAASLFAGTEPVARIDFGSVASPFPFALMIPQSTTEQLLEDALEERGIAIERETALTGLTQGEDAITARLAGPRGEETVRCPWLAGCDGAHSAVRHALALPFAGETLPSRWVLADVHLAGLPLPDQVVMHWHRDGVLGIFPIGPDRFRVIADLEAGGGAAPPPTLAEVQGLIDRRGPGGVTARDPVWLSSFTINERKLADYRHGRVLLAGDAAHVHSPAGGQGMNTGMQDAANLAWKLALVVRREAAAEPLLGSYSDERSAVGDEVLRNAGRLTGVATLRNPLLRAVRDHAVRALFGFTRVQHAAADQMTEVAIHYETGALVERGQDGRGGPPSGHPVPFGAGDAPFGTGARPRFSLCGAVAGAADLPGRFPDLLDPAPRPPLGGADAVWLVRPDGYVATAARDASAVAAYLERLQG